MLKFHTFLLVLFVSDAQRDNFCMSSQNNSDYCGTKQSSKSESSIVDRRGEPLVHFESGQ